MRCLPFRTPSPPGYRRRTAGAGGYRGDRLRWHRAGGSGLPQLTTVEQPSRAIGRTAVSLLMKRIDDPDAAVERVMMDWRVTAPRLRIRGEGAGQRANIVAGGRLMNA
ncbi:substrate-binding domain-containing protein [Klebsiella pneumoniae]|uniref:substrate-binding domain-containing protein n=1 Tax=Klebsiella pneumoniae TaxID=573 RepID=UPI00396F61F3